MIKRIYESNKGEKRGSICYDTLLTANNIIVSSFYKNKIESVTKTNLNKNILKIKDKDNNPTSIIKRIHLKIINIIFLFFVIKFPTIQTLSDDDNLYSTKLELSYINLKIRTIGFKNNKDSFSLIGQNIILNEDIYININRKKFNENCNIINLFLSYIEISTMKKKFIFNNYTILSYLNPKSINKYNLSFFNKYYYEMIIYFI